VSTDVWLSRTQAAQRAGVHRNSIIAWEDKGLLRTRRVPGPTGERVVIRAEDLERALASRPEQVTKPERIAALEAENAYLRERLAEVTAERQELLQEILRIAGGSKPRRR